MRESDERFILSVMNVQDLENWYRVHQRDLPFRHTSDPYTIWVSEVMLQQTQMETVLPYFQRFMNRFPTVETLAEASLETVLTLVQGMGYYRRFKLLHQGALYILSHHKGHFPNTYEDVSKIPGVGAYTSGAIMSIAFNQPFAATDGNVLRVLARFYGVKENLSRPKERNKIHQKHQGNIQLATPKIYTQAVMELGALICRPIQPRCEECPLKKDCYARKHNQTQSLPNIERKQNVLTRYFHTFWLVQNNKIGFIRSKGPLLEGMYLLPQQEVEMFEAEDQAKLFIHQFSHQTWKMKLVQNKTFASSELIWVSVEEMATIPLPQAHKKIVKYMLSI